MLTNEIGKILSDNATTLAPNTHRLCCLRRKRLLTLHRRSSVVVHSVVTVEQPPDGPQEAPDLVQLVHDSVPGLLYSHY